LRRNSPLARPAGGIAARFGLALAIALTTISPAAAVDPGEHLADPLQEARARALSSELRCLVCQNQSIDDSNAPLAKDLRVLVREQIATGKSDRDVLAFIVARYGEFVLLRPRLTLSTALLWFTPLLLLGATAALLYRRRSVTSADAPPLSADEQRRLEQLMTKRS
jgi:cytochrome c-type biogenesis protein CcmH